MRPRFHIGRLIAFIALCGVGLAALRSPSGLWASLMFTVAPATLVVALINVIAGRGGSRAYWAGFALCGWGYFAANFAPWVGEAIGPRLVTTALLDILYPSISPPTPPPAGGWAGGGGGTGMGSSMGGGMPGGSPGMGGPGWSPPPEPGRWQVWTEEDRGSGLGAIAGSVVLASPETFRRIGHSILTILLAGLGGWYARSRFDRREREAIGPNHAGA